MTDHLATGMKRMIRTVARSASLSDRLGERSRLLRLTGNRSTLDFRPAEHGASSWDFEMSITPTDPKPYGMKRFVKCFFELLTQIIVKVRKCKAQRVCVLHFQLAGSGGCFFLMKLYH